MIRRNFFTFMLVMIALAVTANCFAEELTIYDSEGRAQAYIDTDNDLTIYIWSGEPVAYLDKDSIYGFNGKHLGWIDSKVLYDNDGYIVGFLDGGLPIPTMLEPLKGLKKLAPLKSLEALEPLQPMFHSQWASELKHFLLNGK